MTDIANRLKLLREEGHQIISPTFTILYNPYIDTFLLDVPEDKKDFALKTEELEDIYYWDCSGLYPVQVKFNGDYSDVWKELIALCRRSDNRPHTNRIYRERARIYMA